MLTKGKDYLTIQEAIDDAEEGHTIIVPTGTYEENIKFVNKNLTVQSTNPLDSDIVESTIIDGGRSDSVVRFESGDTSTLMGFTIQNGEKNLGGGISVFYSSSTIKENI